jgi:RimJ/RimL family protein N-acetyltransferase
MNEELKVRIAQKKDFSWLSKMDESYLEFGRQFHDPDCVCMILYQNKKPVGYVLYSIHYVWYQVHWVFVKESHRRRGIAFDALQLLFKKVSKSTRRSFVAACIKDRDEIESMKKIRFLRHCGFEVQNVDHEFKGQMILHYNSPEIAVYLIQKRGRLEPYFPQYTHLDLETK